MTTSKLNILFIIDGFLAGGMERQVVELLGGLRNISGISTRLCILSVGSIREKEALEVVDGVLSVNRASNAGWALAIKYPLIMGQILKNCKSQPPDIVHTIGCFSDIIGAVLRSLYDAKWVNGSIRSARPVLNLRDRISRLTFPLADKIVANSNAGLRAFGLPETTGMVIYNGVRLSRFQKPAGIKKIKGKPVLCMVGNLTAKKNHECIVKSLPDLKREYPDIILILIGRGRNYRAINTLATALDCEKNVLIVDNCDNPEPYIFTSEICLLFSSMGEGLSNAIIEYMALERPVVASRCGGNGEIVQHGKTGFLVDGNNPQQIIGYIRKLLNNRSLALDMGRRGKKVIQRRFELNRMVSDYTALYQSLL